MNFRTGRRGSLPKRRLPYLTSAGILGLGLAILAARSFSERATAGAQPSPAFVAGNAALAALPASVGLAHRIGFYVAGDAPELPYISQKGRCAEHGLVDDGGSCLDARDGNSWKAVFPTGLIDIRQFGAKPDDATPADPAVAAADAYSAAIGACTYVPSIYPGFLLRKPIVLNDVGSNCLTGDRGLKNAPQGVRFGKFSDLDFANDSDGIVVNANNGWFVGGLSIKGSAAASASSTHTRGIYLKSVVEGKVVNMFVQDFVVCIYSQSSATLSMRDIFCDDQSGYPNIANDYPYACTEMEQGESGATAALQDTGGECRAQAGGVDAFYAGDGATRWFQICAPVTFKETGMLPTAAPLDCAGATEYGVPLWRADGVKVRIGSTPTLANGQGLLDAPLKICGIDYTIWDVSAAGGGGAGGRQLYCNRITATVQTGRTTILVPSTAGIAAGANILVTADHGLPLATKVVRVADATHLVLSKAPYVSGPLTLGITQLAVATSGPPDYSQACQSAKGQGTNGAACGYKIEIRFRTPPERGVPVDLQWSDPTGYAAYLGEAVSDYVFLQPMLVGGWDVGLKHVGLSNGGIEFRPTYIELLNQCLAIEHQDLPGGGVMAPFGDVAELHRIINDPIPYCPGYVDPKAGPTIVTYNNVRTFLNGAASHAPH